MWKKYIASIMQFNTCYLTPNNIYLVANRVSTLSALILDYFNTEHFMLNQTREQDERSLQETVTTRLYLPFGVNSNMQQCISKIKK